MRISDWSSDVCSSDLEAQRGQLRSALMASFQAMRGQGDGAVVSDDQRRRRMAEAIATALRPLRAQLSSEQQQMLDAELTLQANARRVTEIGRAPCRERECQYVEIPVVAVSLKKKKTQHIVNTHTN